MAIILVVDDEPANRYLIKVLMPEADVREAASGEAALEAIAHDPPDLVVLDLSLPGMSGIECIKRLRQSGSRARVIFYTATTPDAAMRDLADLYKVSDFLPKPCDPREAIAIIERVLA